MKRVILSIAIILTVSASFGQDSQVLTKENTVKTKDIVKIERLDSLEQDIYDKLNDFRLIMIGEMHGTNEPAHFLIGLAELLANNGDSVQVGFEIPSELMTSYIQSPTDSNLLQTDFFLGKFADGRASIAWANAIARLTKNTKVQIFFFDIYEYSENTDGDSLMYLKIKEKIIANPNWRTITLSGNIHNMRTPFKEIQTTAYYLCNDQELNFADRICTLNHFYQSGTMLSNIGKGLELRQFNHPPDIVSETLNFDNYFYLSQQVDIYNGRFFTKNITASEPANKK